jgi:hypothetical protein
MDGTNYNGTIQGTKKILKYETVSGTVTRNAESGYYECDGTAAGRLSFPQKGLVKVVVEVGGKNSEITWTLKENNSLPKILLSDIFGVCYGNGKLVACSAYGNFYVSQDKGSSWAMSNKLSQTYDWMDICYADGNFIAVSNGGYIASSTDGVSWILHGPIEKVPDTSLMGVCYGNGKLVALTLGGYILTGKLDDLSNWKCDGSSIPGAGGCIRIIYVDGYYLTMSGKGAAISLESDETDLWATIWATIKTIPFPSYALCYANQKVVIIDYRSMLVSENKGRSWGCYSVLPSGDSWDNLCHDGENFIAVGYNGLIAVGSYENVTATIKFTNITDGNLTKNNEEYKISNRRELYIEPSQISGTEGNYYIDFSMKNIRLISAEITNRPYSTAGEVVPTTEVTYLDFDIVDFSKGRTSGDVLSYSQTSGSSAYEPGKGYATSNGIGRITLSKPGNVILTVDKLESTTGLTSVSSSWLDSTIAYGNGRWIVLNNIEGFVAVSTDNGVTWIRRGSINGFTSPVRRQVSYGDGKWVALDITGRIVLSEDDGSKWDIIDILPSSASQWSVMRWSNNLGWLALSSDGIVFSGRIRERWERMSSMTAVSTHGWSTAFCNNNDVWAAINSETGAVVIASERDIEYRMRSSLTDSFWYGLDYGNNIWMALNKNGIIATSEGDVTGWNWNIKSTLISSFGSNRWECLCYGDRKWMAVSYQGVVAISEDNGTTWTKQSGGLSTAASAITINSTRQEISGKTSIVISSEQFTQSGSSYVLDINMENIKLVSAKADYNQTETVNDLMMFYSSQESFNRILTYSGSGVWDAYKLYRCSGSGTITSLLKGEIRLTVGPALDTSSSTIQFTSGSDTAVKNITGIQTLTINSSDLVKGSNDNYSVSFNASNISLIKAKLIAEESGGGMQYLPIPSPEMSRVVNFSKNVGGKPEYDKNFIVYGSDTNGSLGSTGVKWDSDISSWVTAPSYGHQYSGSNHFYMNNIAGDFYLNIEDMGNTIPEWFMFVKNINYDSRQPTYNLSGNFRFFSHFSNLYEVSHAHFDIRNAAENANCVLQVGGFTLPVNTALYYGANGSSMHSYQWQSNSSGNLITYDSLVATQQVTTSACNKLKSDWGNNLRIYLIKYRKQSSYKNKINNATINFDYGYIDQCASGSEYIYDVSTDDGLSSVLQTIADDIKSFAGHEGAKNVE